MAVSTGPASRAAANRGFLPQAAAHALAALCLLISFFCSRTPEPLAKIRWRETQMDLRAHWAIGAAFLFCLAWRLLRRKPTLWKSSLALAVLCAIPLAYSAAHSPIRGAALERALFWLDGFLLFWIARSTLAEAPGIFFLLLAGIGALGGLAGFFAPGQALPERALALSMAILAAAALGATRMAAFLRGGLKRPFLPLLVVALGLAAIDWGLTRSAPSVEQAAAEQTARQAPAVGFGLGALPEILPALAAQSWSKLPLPRNGWIALRSEFGWEGLAVVCLLAVGAVLALLFPRQRDSSRQESMWPAAFALACMLALLLFDAARRPVFQSPFGLWLFFALAGMMWGLGGADDEPATDEYEPVEERPWFDGPLVRLGVFGAAALCVWALAAFEARPYQAALLALKRDKEAQDSPFYGYRLRAATRLYPYEATHWTGLGLQRRAALSTKPYSEVAFQGIVTAYEQAIQANPYSVMAYFGLAESYDHATRPAQAVEALRRGLAVLPASEVLRQWLAKIYSESGDARGAIAEMKALECRLPPRLPGAKSSGPAEVNPAWISINFKIAEAYMSLGEADRAFDQYAAAYAKDPSGPTAREAQAAMNKIKAEDEKR